MNNNTLKTQNFKRLKRVTKKTKENNFVKH